ncbi:MAG: hypothetical protein CSA42_00440 [Gammaproteobacteria bacterium]|nr:MAG: hypothetical protein CSA42_00440 [Gammaproteobacteria bacterium]
MGAFKNRPWPMHLCINKNVENHLYQGEQFFGIAMDKAVIHCSSKSTRQYMTHEQVQEIFSLKGSAAKEGHFSDAKNTPS